MPSGVSFSNQHIEISDYADHFNDVSDSLKDFFDPSGPRYVVRWAMMTPPEVTSRFKNRLSEFELTSSLALMSGIEALFRIDYANRVGQRLRDPLSRAFRELYKDQQTRIRLEDQILDLWRDHTSVNRQDVSSLKSAFKYRHWLAHGRYWTPKLGQQYRYRDIHNLAVAVRTGFPFILD
ncbi:hypothetical protein CFBP6626_15245 [Agrobacterium tumefaciens]|nr:hypothetical protein CFBP6626_15245 [Agrobacterium tumefaciens]CUX48971.1 conserved hypothetical protein [Agrobacterium genomosp. 5 str. CFBP 6626]